MKIITVIGARPQFIKAAAISRIIKQQDHIQEIIVHTGQHYDQKMSDIFFSELDIPRPNYNLAVGSGSHGKQTGLMLERIESVLLKEQPDGLITYGDTNSTLAAALAAVKLQIPIAHIEAGLRSFNRSMPEEINRIMTDHISDILLAPTQNAMHLLASEGLKEKSFFVGDVMFDSILFYKELARHKQKEFINIPQKKYYLCTIHRPENTDNHTRLQNIFSGLSELNHQVIIPLHPRTSKILRNIHYSDNIKVIEPIGYLNMIALVNNAEIILTDSGGLQKEAYFLKKRCITLRDQTEWIETLENSWNFIVGANKSLIVEKSSIKPTGPQTHAFGDGHASEKIIHILNRYFS